METGDTKKSAGNPFTREKLAEDVLNEWQSLIDSTAEIFGVPAGLITRIDEGQIEILLSSRSGNNPFPEGYRAIYPGSSWYCEHTLKKRDLLLVPDAFRDPLWRENPSAVDLGMISYVGMPIVRPDGREFGTVCFLDNKANPHNRLHIKLLTQIRRMIELTLRVIYDKEVMDQQEHLLNDLSRIYPICNCCGKIRDHAGPWVTVERFLENATGALASYGTCPDCVGRREKPPSIPGR